MNPSNVKPPRMPQRLLELLGGRRASFMLGELNEEFATFVLADRGLRRARVWYTWQVLRSVPAVLSRSALPAPRPSWHTSLANLLHIRDIAHAVRGLRRAPTFSLAIIGMLGLGVGAGASIFALIDMLLLRAPPGITEPDRVRALGVRTRNVRGEFVSRSLAWIDYEMLRDAETSVESAAGWFSTRRSFGRGPEARLVDVMLVTPTFFGVLGAQPALGRFFRDDEDQVGVNPLPCILGHRFWMREFDGRDGVLGTELAIGELQCVVVGVTAEGFSGVNVQVVDVWLPVRAASAGSIARDPLLLTSDRSHWLRIVARLKPGVSDEVASAEATAVYRGVTPRVRDPDAEGTAEWLSILPGRASFGNAVDITKLLLGGSALLLLLIAVNLTNLMVVRELARGRETAIRLALGSPASRLFVSRMWEAGLLSVGAGVLGVLVAFWFGPVVRATLLSSVDFVQGPVTARVVVFTVGLALVTGMSIAGVASFRAASADPGILLAAAGSPRAGTSRRRNLLQMGLVGVQSALSMALLVGSFAFVTSFHRATTVDLGFDRENVIVAEAPLSIDDFSVSEQRQIYEQLWQQVAALPGVESASLAYMTPWWNNRGERTFIPGRDSLPEDPVMGFPVFDVVTPEYLETMGMTLLAGRWVTSADQVGSEPVVVINQAMNALYWPGENAIGKCMHVGDDPGTTPCRTVVGIVANHAFTGNLTTARSSAYFIPYHQSAEYDVIPKLFVRAEQNLIGVLPTIARLVQSVRPNLPAAQIFAMDRRFEPLVAPWRVGSYAFTALGVLATAVGTFGLFSILTYVVASRRQEFCVRAAIGGSVTQIALPVVRRGILTVLTGVVVGGVLTFMLRGVLQPLLYETDLTALPALLAAGGISVVVAVCATVFPARQAGRGSPLEALRSSD